MAGNLEKLLALVLDQEESLQCAAVEKGFAEFWRQWCLCNTADDGFREHLKSIWLDGFAAGSHHEVMRQMETKKPLTKKG